MATTTKARTLQDRLDVLREQHGVPAASVAVLQGEAIDAAASGILNLATGVEATADSLFQIGSITKVWTATLVMQLVDEGRIDLDEPVRRYLPNFRVADDGVSEAVTIRHLLTHTSGIDGDHFADTGRGDDALQRYVETCAELPQVHPPGATMSYCNTGYTVLGRMLEVVSEPSGTTCCERGSSTRSSSPTPSRCPRMFSAFGPPWGTSSRRDRSYSPRRPGGCRVLQGRPERSARRQASSSRSPGCISGTGSAPMASGC